MTPKSKKGQRGTARAMMRVRGARMSSEGGIESSL